VAGREQAGWDSMKSALAKTTLVFSRILNFPLGLKWVDFARRGLDRRERGATPPI